MAISVRRLSVPVKYVKYVERLAVQSAKNGSEMESGADIEVRASFSFGRGMRSGVSPPFDKVSVGPDKGLVAPGKTTDNDQG